MDEKKTIDYSNLEEKLAELDARAFQRAERACRISTDPTPDIMYSGNFRARLAAEALGVEYSEIMDSGLQTYSAIINHVLVFLLGNLEMEIRPKN